MREALVVTVSAQSLLYLLSATALPGCRSVGRDFVVIIQDLPSLGLRGVTWMSHGPCRLLQSHESH